MVDTPRGQPLPHPPPFARRGFGSGELPCPEDAGLTETHRKQISLPSAASQRGRNRITQMTPDERRRSCFGLCLGYLHHTPAIAHGRK